ncbi:hypothetical protein Ac2012v2_008167 [Leucoagaricus gongylophorus]
MVSFQCHNCGDVVKKPKLDQHWSRCHGGFDCIDCSTSFHSPTEYKIHTSCISEAEKYQKSLYKGPKSGTGQRNNSNNNQQYRDHSRSYQNGSHDYGVRGCGQPSWGAPRSQATGANDTPLGATIRISPLSKPAEVEEEKAEEAGHKTVQMETSVMGLKRKKDNKDNKEEGKGDRKERGEKDKKRKVDDEGTRGNVHSSKKKKDVKKEKERRKKKEKEKEKVKELKESELESMAEGREVKEKRNKKERKKKGEAMVSEMSVVANINVDVDAASPEYTSNNDTKSRKLKDKKKEKNKQKTSAKRDDDQDGEMIESVEAQEQGTETKEKKRRRESKEKRKEHERGRNKVDGNVMIATVEVQET